MALMQTKLTIRQNIKQPKYSHTICRRYQATLASWKPILHILAEQTTQFGQYRTGDAYAAMAGAWSTVKPNYESIIC